MILAATGVFNDSSLLEQKKNQISIINIYYIIILNQIICTMNIFMKIQTYLKIIIY